MDGGENPDTEQQAFGSQLLDAIRHEGLPLSGFDYAVLQELKRADREETIRILRRHSPQIGYAAVQALKREDPDAIAARLARMQPLASAQASMTMLMMIAMMT